MTELRDISIEKDYTTMSLSSVLYTSGETKVLITTSVSDFLPRWLVGENYGWVTAEYSMLPRATLTRTPRERGTSSGRSHEISRLVGRSLRAVVDFSELGERTLTVDCDVIQADAGTRTATITGSYVCLLNTTDAADEGLGVALGGCRVRQENNNTERWRRQDSGRNVSR